MSEDCICATKKIRSDSSMLLTTTGQVIKYLIMYSVLTFGIKCSTNAKRMSKNTY